MTQPTEPNEPSDAEYGLVMPFVLCKTNGGPYDDAAFVAGVTCGALDEELRLLAHLRAIPRERYINAAYLPQVDLIAMTHGYTTTLGELDEPSGWQVVAFAASEADHV